MREKPQYTSNIQMGFTGTRSGLTPQQKHELGRIADDHLAPAEFHHGDCKGADFEAFILFKCSGLITVSHPPTNSKHRAFTRNDKEFPPQDYLARNRSIVDKTDFLVACPRTKNEEVRSGTWATIRYARKRGKPVAIIYPNGEIDVGRR